MKGLLNTWRETFGVLNRRPKIMIPFLIVGIVNVIIIYLLYAAPQRPFSYLLAPPIRAFFGEKFLHYPLNFYILPTAFNRLEILVSAFLGMFMSAISVGMIADVKKGERALVFLNLIRALKRYFILLVTWGIIFGVITVAGKLLSKLPQHYVGASGLGLTGAYFLLTILVNILFVYMVPALIIKNKNIFSALKDNFRALKNLFFSTAILVALPSMVYFPIVAAEVKTSALIEAFFPEVVMVVLLAGVVVITLVEMLITTSTTLLYLNQGGSK